MGCKVIVRQAVEADIERIVPRVREADISELWAMSRHSPAQAMKVGLTASEACLVGEINGEVACMFGVMRESVLSRTGVPWMIGTDLLDRYPLSFYRRCYPYVRVMAEEFPLLENWVDARNTRSIRWLKSLGFTIHQAEPAGISRLPFHRFTMGG